MSYLITSWEAVVAHFSTSCCVLGLPSRGTSIMSVYFGRTVYWSGRIGQRKNLAITRGNSYVSSCRCRLFYTHSDKGNNIINAVPFQWYFVFCKKKDYQLIQRKNYTEISENYIYSYNIHHRHLFSNHLKLDYFWSVDLLGWWLLSWLIDNPFILHGQRRQSHADTTRIILE